MKKRLLSIVLLSIPVLGYSQIVKSIIKGALASGVKSLINPPVVTYTPPTAGITKNAVKDAISNQYAPNVDNNKTKVQLPSTSDLLPHTINLQDGIDKITATLEKMKTPMVFDSHPLVESEFLADGALERNGFRITYSDSTYVKFVGAAYGISDEARFGLDKNTMNLTVLIPISSNLDDAVEVYDFLNNKLSQDFNGSSVDYKLRNTMPVEDYYTLYICPSGAGGVYIQNRSIENYYAVRLVFIHRRFNDK